MTGDTKTTETATYQIQDRIRNILINENRARAKVESWFHSKLLDLIDNAMSSSVQHPTRLPAKRERF